jgi:WD40 repeat protein
MVGGRPFLTALIALVIPLSVSAQPPASKALKPIRTDLYGDPLPGGALARLGTLRFRHPGLRKVAWSPEGNTLASLNWDGSIIFWDVSTGQELRTMTPEEDDIRGDSLAWSPDGKMIASACSIDPYSTFFPEYIICLWNVTTGNENRRLKGHGSFMDALAWSPDGKMLASSSDKSIRLWEAATGKEVRCLAGDGYIQSLAWSPDSRVLAGASTDKTIQLWDTLTGKEIQRFRDPDYLGGPLAWSPDGKKLASASHGTALLSWTITSAASGGRQPPD